MWVYLLCVCGLIKMYLNWFESIWVCLHVLAFIQNCMISIELTSSELNRNRINIFQFGLNRIKLNSIEFRWSQSNSIELNEFQFNSIELSWNKLRLNWSRPSSITCDWMKLSSLEIDWNHRTQLKSIEIYWIQWKGDLPLYPIRCAALSWKLSAWSENACAASQAKTPLARAVSSLLHFCAGWCKRKLISHAFCCSLSLKSNSEREQQKAWKNKLSEQEPSAGKGKGSRGPKKALPEGLGGCQIGGDGKKAGAGRFHFQTWEIPSSKSPES